MTTPQTPSLAAAGASSSSSIPIPKYKVFLSFEDDTSTSFSDHLHKSMVRKGIDTFWGYENIEKGETIDTNRLKAIEESRFAVVVFSREYPSSAERLDELVKIAEMKLERVYPVFYDVEPTEVKKQKGTFGDAFDQLLAREDFDVGKVNKWRNVLTEMANLAGWALKSKYESEVIEKITQQISDKLNNIISSSEDDLVDMDHHIANLLPFLGLGESDDVRVIGIWGMPGLGEKLQSRVCCQFDASCFIEKVRDCKSLVPLQESVYKELVNDEPKIQTSRDGTKKLGAKLHSKKVLIILDDVDHEEQIKYLTGDCKLKPGSRIIVTTRNKHLLETFGEKNVFEVVNLAQDDALKLLCKNAFKKDHPPKEYEEVCKEVVRYAGGLPLALKVLGRFLVRRSEKEWYSTLKRLEKDHDEDDILCVLKISFDGLRQSEKELFLDIACFFQGEPQYRVEKILESSAGELSISIQLLVEKALIRIGGKDRCLWMHDLLQELGKEIVRRKSFQESDLKKPQKRSRLWDPEDISDVLKKNEGTEAIKGIFLTFPERKTIELNDDPFQRMKKLKLLKIHNADFSKNPGYLCNELRLLEWDGYPSTSLPTSFQPKNLVELNMPNSRIEQLWEESDMVLQMLLWIDLSDCKYLTRTPSFSMTPNLEKLILKDCESLSEIHPSLEVLKKLGDLDLEGCKNLLSLPSGICGLTSLKVLNLSGCSRLAQLPEKLGSMEQLEVLNASGTGIRKVPSFIKRLMKLKVLSFSGCKGVALDTEECSEPIGLRLPDSFVGLTSLRSLDLSGCNLSDGAIPHDIGCLSSLQILDLSENNFISIPDSICQLFDLRALRLNGCKKLRSLPKPPCISVIEARDCHKLENNPRRTIEPSNSGLCVIDCSNSKEEKNYAKCDKHFHLAPIAKEDRHSQLRKHIEGEINRSALAQIGLAIGDEIIPEWCRHPNTESSITVQMSYPDVDGDSMWMGLALCVISLGVPDSGSTQFTCHFGTGETRRQKSLVLDDISLRGPVQHFAYIPREWFSGELGFATSITASVSFSDAKVKVEKCGAVVITKQNVEKFIGSLFKEIITEQDAIEECAMSIKCLSHRKLPYSHFSGFSLRLHDRNSWPSITIQHLRPCLCLERDDNWIGLALFACFSYPDEQPTTFVDHHFISRLETERGSSEPILVYQTDNKEFKWLNHGGQFFWLSYVPKKWFLGNLNQCSSLEASFASEGQGLGVKMCGLRLVYRHDKDYFEQTIKGCCCLRIKGNQMILRIRVNKLWNDFSMCFLASQQISIFFSFFLLNSQLRNYYFSRDE
ncbi:hypothetical protein UlMin_033485 [Ulmus minor]